MTSQGSKLNLFHCLPIPTGDLKDLYDFQAIRMVIVHNIILRGFNSLVYYSGEIKPQTTRFDAFLGYCNEILHFLHEHHLMEEEMYFPLLESRLGAGTMSDNIEGHDRFKLPLERLEALVQTIRDGQEGWSVETFRARIYELVPLLREHFAEEIESLRSWKLKDRIRVDELQAFESTLEAHIKNKSSLAKDLQLLYVNGDAVHGAWFPEVPLAISVLTRYILWPIHSDWWEFGCCNRNMVVKPQFASYEPGREDEVASTTG